LIDRRSPSIKPVPDHLGVRSFEVLELQSVLQLAQHDPGLLLVDGAAQHEAVRRAWLPVEGAGERAFEGIGGAAAAADAVERMEQLRYGAALDRFESIGDAFDVAEDAVRELALAFLRRSRG
jgi:hypothetical protein